MYTVQHGDTLAKLAVFYGTTVNAWLDENEELELRTPGYLIPGEKLKPPKRGRKRTAAPYECVEEFGPRELKIWMQNLQNKEYANVRTESIGASVLGWPLELIKLGQGNKKIFLSAGWHANEWHTSLFLIRMIEDLLKNESTYDGVEVSVLPMVNPDGIQLVQEGVYPGHPYKNEVLSINDGVPFFDHWTANIRGVDLNHQWPAGWKREAYTSPQSAAPKHYGGKAPLTEPETRAVYQWVEEIQPDAVLAFHSQGEEIFWGYRQKEPAESASWAVRLAQASAYRPIRQADSYAGFKDWFIDRFEKPGFTIEMGRGENPLPFAAFPNMWIHGRRLVYEALQLANEE
ncbi:gamma-D-glutamyl-{L}-meso-diaminopimelate peptidase I [Salsuginibacillus halophilus]|uniref:Gamma-D-glutamyl-(L)-meso-diaminopimelate peptidase I n=1 Tax=Salsuginibacillus halophilus TaxID=517424 RepID=A0A2P8HWB3_9BACI|nr:M14 family metallopeptidase [Salsuginibacillus halophilus]PSL50455.1 gamma-D-glutamyl-{L}-meso-diaminopimelate peptidase I [Salsuginibacillus halophilus]